MSRPTVLVVAIPYVFASALAQGIERHRTGVYEIAAPRLAEGEPIPPVRFDAVITSLPVPDVDADVVIELPSSLHDVVQVTVGGVTAPVSISPDQPIDEITALLDRYITPSPERERGGDDRSTTGGRAHLE